MSGYQLWVNTDRTILVRQHPDGTMDVATRPQPAATWGPPVTVHPEPTR